MNIKNIFKAFKNKQFRNRILSVVGIIAVFRLVAHIPVPLGDASTFKEAVANIVGSSDLGGFINIISGGGLATLSILLVGLSPYITSSIIMQLASKAVPKLEELSQDGESGRKKINQYTRMLTVPLAILQSIAYIFILYNTAVATNTVSGFEPTMFDWTLSVVAMTAASILLMWFGELITEQGVGNGMSTIIFIGIISSLPSTIGQLLANADLFNTSYGAINFLGLFTIPVNPFSFFTILGLLIATIAILYFVTKINEAQRIINIHYAKRINSTNSYKNVKSIIPLKLMSAGVIPIIFSVAFLSLPVFIGQIIRTNDPTNVMANNLIDWFSSPSADNFAGLTPQWFIYPIAYLILIVAFTYFYTSIVFDTKQIAENLQNQGSFIDGVKPGAETEKYLGRTMRRLNLFGALSLGLIAMLPFITDYIFIVVSGRPIGLSISGTSILIIISVALENLRQINSRALMITYDSYK